MENENLFRLFVLLFSPPDFSFLFIRILKKVVYKFPHHFSIKNEIFFSTYLKFHLRLVQRRSKLCLPMPLMDSEFYRRSVFGITIDIIAMIPNTLGVGWSIVRRQWRHWNLKVTLANCSGQKQDHP